MNILFIGDIIGSPGREKVSDLLPILREKHSIDFTIANGENSAGGAGITKKTSEDLFSAGVDVITLGNHSFDRREFTETIDHPKIIRPANYPEGVPGKGLCSVDITTPDSNKTIKVTVVNLLGRFNMPLVDCPFRTADKILEQLSRLKPRPIIIVDFHAELTSEKQALGFFLDGRVSGVVGTHTHVQTSDEKILANGTGYITDAGMVGSSDSIIGVEKSDVLKRFLTGMPAKFQVAKNDIFFNGIVLTIDAESGKCNKVCRIIG
ncbi:MAG: TIGR00282 family metallophosphoesterase [Elusimicrobia bacterium]|nr:TIGR00282 family metallophosphoesterase [Elusimicrobiota bacterium]